MHRSTKAIFSMLLVLGFVAQPLTVFAQTAAGSAAAGAAAAGAAAGVQGGVTPTTQDPCRGMTGTDLTRCRNLQSAAPVLQRFNPNATLSGGNSRTFSGLSFSGVGGAIAGCTNIGGTISSGIGSIAGIFNNKKPTTATTPTANPDRLDEAVDLHDTTEGISDTANSFVDSTMATLESVPVVSEKTDEELKKMNQREQCLNGVAYAIAKSLLQQVTNKTLAWVNTGLGGNPLYVRDLDSFLRTISDQQVARFIDEIPRQNPVFGTAIRSIITEQISGIQDGMIGTVMDTPEARAYQSFQEDFTNGGWAAFLDPRYNAVDAIFDAGEQLSRNIENQTQDVRDQLQRNDGFLDLKRCVESKASNYPFLYEGLSCSTDIGTEYLKKYRECTQAGGQTTVQCDSSVRSALASKVSTNCITAAKAEALKNTGESCLRYETVTPGSIIAAQVANVTTSPVRQLEQADQINEVLGGFFDQLLNRLLANGLASLRGRSDEQFSFSSFGSNVVFGTTGGALSSAQAGATALGYREAGIGYNGDFDVSRPQHVRAVLETQYNYLNRVRDARAALNRIVPTLGALDYCIPGPNPTWQEGLNDNVQNYFGSLQPVQPNSTLAGRILQSIPILGGLFGNNKPDTFAATDVPLFDKATGTPIALPYATVFHINNRSLEFIFNNIKWRWEELYRDYTSTFTFDRIANAFAAADAGNAAFARGSIASAFEETARLPSYAAASFEIDRFYETSEQQAIDAINTLESIRAEANQIVSVARARHMSEQAAAGTPVNMSCFANAYVMNPNPITPDPRQESNAVSPLFQQFIEANNYFYSNL